NFTQVDISNSSTLPHLTTCFQHTILAYIPTVFLCVFFPILIVQSNRISRRFDALPWSALLIIKMVINLYLLLNSVAVLVLNTLVVDDTHTVDIIYPVVWILFFVLHLIIDLNRRRCGHVSAGIQHLSFILFTICGVPEFAYHIENQVCEYPTIIFAMYMAFWPVIVLQMLLYAWSDRRAPKADKSAELDSSFINRLTIWWFTGVQITGSKRDLQMEDLHELNRGATSEHLATLFEKYWLPAMKAHQMKKSELLKKGVEKEPAEPSLVYALYRMYKYEFITASLLKILSDTLQFAQPFLLNQLIGFVSSPDAPFWMGLSYAILMFLTSEIRSMILNAYFNIMMRMSMKVQTSLTTAVYRKTLRLSATARRKRTVGEIINLMAIDVEVFQMITPQIQQFWSCPYQIVFALVYLFLTLGYSASPGVVIMILFVPINIFSSIFIKGWQTRQMKLKDERVKMVNEILNGIKVIKLYAWEEPMERHVAEIRERELDLIKKAQLVKSLLDTFNNASPFLVAASSFGTFILSSDAHILTPQIAFVSLTLFNQLKSPMIIVAMLINLIVQAIVSNRRLRNFLLSEELNESDVKRNPHAESSANAIEFRNADATWEADATAKPSLADISVCVPKGSLLAVVGTVGSGKSSFLSAMLGELTRLRGDITVNGRLAYVPQQSWIQNLTLRDNITFGKPYNYTWYNKVNRS
ncbi:hypothetical protein PFISCL1PPCAC_14270, partial [Pristionchus fissidentatus]